MKDVSTFIALHRFGLGPAPDESARLGDDPRGWLVAQTRRAPLIESRPHPFEDSATLLGRIHESRRDGPERLRETLGSLYRRVFAAEVVERTRLMATTESPFAERMVAFWSNHFTVSSSKRIIGPAIPAYERETIRPHVFGRFADMLRAVVSHPVMLVYLDNQVSMGTGSEAGGRRVRRKGNVSTLNENLAREILELHTLGVGGGYTQADVIELARAISGWSHGGVRGRHDARPVHGRFEFRPEFHEPGPRRLLGRAYAEAGVEQGMAVLADLARHPATAGFIASKLVRHFVADDPPPDAVARIARVFRESEGDLGRVSRAVVELPHAWREPLSKVKSHYELLVATHRATRGGLLRRANVRAPLRELGQVPFTAPSPQGWGDTQAHWIAPEALMRRVQLLRQHAAGLPATLHPARMLDELIGPVAGEATRTWVARAPSGDAAIAMLLASPEFQRR